MRFFLFCRFQRAGISSDFWRPAAFIILLIFFFNKLTYPRKSNIILYEDKILLIKNMIVLLKLVNIY